MHHVSNIYKQHSWDSLLIMWCAWRISLAGGGYRGSVWPMVCFNVESNHDDVIKWNHFPRHRPFVRGIHRSPVNSPHKGQWRGAFMFSLICAWINAWANNREAGLLLFISMLWQRQTIFESKGDKLSSSFECRIRTRISRTESPADWMPADKPTELSTIKI